MPFISSIRGNFSAVGIRKTAGRLPGVPTSVSATATDATTASVSFSAPVDAGASAITGFTVTSSPEGITATGSSSPITVSGLTTGTAYTFTVTATNAGGTGPASAASNSVTPVQPAVFYVFSTTTTTPIPAGTYSGFVIGGGGAGTGNHTSGTSAANLTHRINNVVHGGGSVTFTIGAGAPSTGVAGNEDVGPAGGTTSITYNGGSFSATSVGGAEVNAGSPPGSSGGGGGSQGSAGSTGGNGGTAGSNGTLATGSPIFPAGSGIGTGPWEVVRAALNTGAQAADGPGVSVTAGSGGQGGQAGEGPGGGGGGGFNFNGFPGITNPLNVMNSGSSTSRTSPRSGFSGAGFGAGGGAGGYNGPNGYGTGSPGRPGIAVLWK